jgi:hypothetical protein
MFATPVRDLRDVERGHVERAGRAIAQSCAKRRDGYATFFDTGGGIVGQLVEENS